MKRKVWRQGIELSKRHPELKCRSWRSEEDVIIVEDLADEQAAHDESRRITG